MDGEGEMRLGVALMDTAAAQRVVTKNFGTDYVFPRLKATDNKVLCLTLPLDVSPPATLYPKMLDDFYAKNNITPLFDAVAGDTRLAFLPADPGIVDMLVPAGLMGGKLAETLKNDIIAMPSGKDSIKLQ